MLSWSARALRGKCIIQSVILAIFWKKLNGLIQVVLLPDSSKSGEEEKAKWYGPWYNKHFLGLLWLVVFPAIIVFLYILCDSPWHKLVGNLHWYFFPLVAVHSLFSLVGDNLFAIVNPGTSSFSSFSNLSSACPMS